MLKARDFVKIDFQHPSGEVVRLESLNAQIDKQPLEVKQQLWTDLLEIVTNQNEELQARTLACNILGGRHDELQLNKLHVVKKLQEVLNGEFIVYKPSTFFLKRRKLHLRQIDLIKSCFLQILLSTLLRIDFDNTHQVVKEIVDKMDNKELKENLSHLFEKEKLRQSNN